MTLINVFQLSSFFAFGTLTERGKKNLNKVKDPAQKAEVYQKLCQLRNETNLEKFKQLLSKFLTDLSSNTACSEFAKYFTQHYAKRAEC